jgi:hypothetical protein
MAARLVVLFLRLAGTVTVFAFLAILLPVDWMASTHRAIGLGEFPRAPVVDYLARSVAALYGFHGLLLLLVSTDIVRYRPVVWFIAALNITFGLMIVAIDLHAGMPLFWTLWEGPSIIAFGAILMVLMRSIPAPRLRSGQPTR